MESFLDRVKMLNENSQGFGNEIIYSGCDNDLTQLRDLKKLTGTIWLIGRSYAASPQRRSYGTSKYIQPIKGHMKMPIWPITTENSGKGEFFDFLAEQISKDEQIEEIEECLHSNKRYEFNCKEEDITLLANVIKSVSIFNRLIKRATEKFDDVPNNHIHTISSKHSKTNKEEIEYVYVKNQVSFCSKFLHFYRRDLVFIIDQFSKNGSTWLFKNSKHQENFVLTLSEVNTTKNEGATLEDEIAINISEFQSSPSFIKFKKEIKFIKKAVFKKLEEEFGKDSEELNHLGKQKRIVDDYIDHCIRSYLLCCILNDKGIKPKVSFPRLSDAIFMRIKPEKSKEENKSIKDIYFGENP